MKLADYRKKLFLKSYKKYIELLDTKRQSGYQKGYEKYFNHVLRILQPDFVNSSNSLKLIENQCKKNDNLVRNIYVMWWQGIENAPALIQNNIRRIQRIFGKDNVHIITEDNWKHYCAISNIIIEKFNAGKISIIALSDIIRFNLLNNYGGLWIDSTVILNNNSKKILSDYSDKDFFTISNLDEDYHFISKSRWTVWFIGGKAGYPLFEFATSFYNEYFKKHDFLIDYYTTDDILAYFYKNNEKFKEDVNSIYNDWQPYLWSTNMYDSYNKQLIEKFENKDIYSIQKFTYKYDKNLADNTNSLIHFILNSKHY